METESLSEVIRMHLSSIPVRAKARGTLVVPLSKKIPDGTTYRGTDYKTYQSYSKFMKIDYELVGAKHRFVRGEIVKEGGQYEFSFSPCAFEDGGKPNMAIGKLDVAQAATLLDVAQVKTALDTRASLLQQLDF